MTYFPTKSTETVSQAKCSHIFRSSPATKVPRPTMFRFRDRLFMPSRLPFRGLNGWSLEATDSTTMVGDLKTTEIEYSLRFSPLIDGLSADEAVRRAYQGLIKKLVDLSPKPDAGKAFKVRLIFSANLATRLLLRQHDSNASPTPELPPEQWRAELPSTQQEWGLGPVEIRGRIHHCISGWCCQPLNFKGLYPGRDQFFWALRAWKRCYWEM